MSVGVRVVQAGVIREGSAQLFVQDMQLGPLPVGPVQPGPHPHGTPLLAGGPYLNEVFDHVTCLGSSSAVQLGEEDAVVEGHVMGHGRIHTVSRHIVGEFGDDLEQRYAFGEGPLGRNAVNPDDFLGNREAIRPDYITSLRDAASTTSAITSSALTSASSAITYLPGQLDEATV